jgi:hypothetical protein
MTEVPVLDLIEALPHRLRANLNPPETTGEVS